MKNSNIIILLFFFCVKFQVSNMFSHKTDPTYTPSTDTSSLRKESIRSTHLASDHISNSVLRAEGSFITSRLIGRKTGRKAASIKEVFLSMTTPIEHDYHVGQAKEINRGTIVYYKCPPSLIKPQALKRYGMDLSSYTILYNTEMRKGLSQNLRDIIEERSPYNDNNGGSTGRNWHYSMTPTRFSAAQNFISDRDLWSRPGPIVINDCDNDESSNGSNCDSNQNQNVQNEYRRSETSEEQSTYNTDDEECEIIKDHSGHKTCNEADRNPSEIKCVTVTESDGNTRDAVDVNPAPDAVIDDLEVYDNCVDSCSSNEVDDDRGKDLDSTQTANNKENLHSLDSHTSKALNELNNKTSVEREEMASSADYNYVVSHGEENLLSSNADSEMTNTPLKSLEKLVSF